MKFISKPVTVEALQYTGENIKEILEFARPHAYYSETIKKLRVRTHNGEVTVQPTDWIIVNSLEAYPVPHDVMQAKYTAFDNKFSTLEGKDDGNTKTDGNAGDVTVL